jgi:hypothetical protein
MAGIPSVTADEPAKLSWRIIFALTITTIASGGCAAYLGELTTTEGRINRLCPPLRFSFRI